MIRLCKEILTGEKVDKATLDHFQEYRRDWFPKYQYKHGRSFYGYANTWNVQAKIGFQIATQEAKGEPFDADHTVYNREYMLKILDAGEKEIVSGLF